ncbi:MAG: purine-nucleoside phosphorylase, partial [bacterium]|nr:purine-nucleoside phosphorylase [bacterium]
MSYELLEEAAAAIAELSGRPDHSAAVVLGSGLGDYTDSLPDARAIPYSEIPNFPTPRVAGHSGTLYSVDVGGRGALLFSGRVHFYEGWSMDEVVFGVRTAIAAGAKTIVLTNAAGSINPEIRPGSLVS